MKNPSSALPQKVASAVGLLFGALALSALAATNTWTAPASAPPVGNVDAPLNVGSTVQTKSGGSIQINGGFGISGGVFVYHPTLANPVVGQVLVNKDIYGTVGWVSTSTLMSSSGTSGSVGGGCYSNWIGMGANYSVASVAYSTWGNATTPYPDSTTHANYTQSASGCTCPSGYTADPTGEGMASPGNVGLVIYLSFMCVKN